MKSISKQQLIMIVRNLMYVVFGTAILAFGTAVFIVPFNLVTGGVSGIAIVLEHVLPFSISVDIYIGILTWSLFILGMFTLGKQFAMRTLVSSLCYPVFFSLFYRLVDPNVLNGIFVLQNTEFQDIAVLIAAVFGGVLVGLGCALSFIGGGSTGGVDILAFMICKYVKRCKSTHIIFLIDALIISFGVLVINDTILSLLGISSALVCSMMIDKVFLGSSTAHVAHIVTEHADSICNQVIKRMDRTATIVEAKGAYSGANKTIVIVSFSIREYSTLMDIVKTTDAKSFMTIYRAHETHGEGWL